MDVENTIVTLEQRLMQCWILSKFPFDRKGFLPYSFIITSDIAAA